MGLPLCREARLIVVEMAATYFKSRYFRSLDASAAAARRSCGKSTTPRRAAKGGGGPKAPLPPETPQEHYRNI